LDCLKYAYENGCPWAPETTFGAAKNGYLDCLKYACEAGCPWAPETTFGAAWNGHLDCLKYAHSQGCPWDDNTIFASTYKDNFECLLYCLENECPIDLKILDLLIKKQKNKNLVMNVLLRKILFNPRLKKNITSKKYPSLNKAIKSYKKYKNNVYRFFEYKTNLPTDIIKYEILKYI
jgi:hypothetical protein